MQVPVEVDYHQFVLGEGGSPEATQDLTEATCLIFEPRVSEAAILTGCASGSVLVEVEALRSAPEQVDDRWQDVAEVSLRVGHAPLRARGWGGTGPSTDRLDAAGPGTYRVRVHARGRDTDPDGVAFEPVEEFLLQAWPAAHEPPRTLIATSQVAHGELAHKTG